jgi:hypothetical protein
MKVEPRYIAGSMSIKAPLKITEPVCRQIDSGLMRHDEAKVEQ